MTKKTKQTERERNFVAEFIICCLFSFNPKISVHFLQYEINGFIVSIASLLHWMHHNEGPRYPARDQTI